MAATHSNLFAIDDQGKLVTWMWSSNALPAFIQQPVDALNETLQTNERVMYMGKAARGALRRNCLICRQ